MVTMAILAKEMAIVVTTIITIAITITTIATGKVDTHM